MRKIYFSIMLIVVLLLVACNTDTNAPDEENENAVNNNNQEEQIVDEETAPTDLADVFAEMAAATNDVESVTAESLHINTSKTLDDTIVSENEITSETIMDPYTQHVDYKTISREGDGSEIYFNDDSMYVHFPEDGWFESDNYLDDVGIGNAIKERDINNFIDNIDLFELKDDGDDFLITYIGPDEKFDDVFSSIEMKPASLNALLDDMDETVVSTGEIEMKVSKETFLITEYHYVAHSKDAEVIDTEITDDVSTVYIYNNVDSFIIPEEIVEESATLEIPK